MTRALPLALLVALAASCGGQPPPPKPPPPPELKNEISDLWMQIRQWRAEIELRGVEPPWHMIRSVFHMPMHDLRSELARLCVAPPQPAAACEDVCSIAEHICENADRICRIADQLGDDDWADRKCASAKASCKEAKEQCCECEADHDGDDGDDGDDGNDGGDTGGD